MQSETSQCLGLQLNVYKVNQSRHISLVAQVFSLFYNNWYVLKKTAVLSLYEDEMSVHTNFRISFIF